MLLFSFVNGNNSSGQRTRRNLAEYAKAGPFTICNELPPEAGEQKMAEIRGFLWKNWNERHLGVVTVTFCSIEGDPTLSTFFVEPDAQHHWQVRVKSNLTESSLLPKGRAIHRKTSEDYDEVGRVDIKDQSSQITDDGPRDARTFRIRLKNTRTKSERVL